MFLMITLTIRNLPSHDTSFSVTVNLLVSSWSLGKTALQPYITPLMMAVPLTTAKLTTCAANAVEV